MSAQHSLSKTTILLHWLIAIAIIGSIAFGMYLEELPRSPEKGQLIGLHKSIGVTILIFATYRIGLRLIQGLPKPLPNTSTLQRKAAKAAHILLLIGTVALPISGLMMSIGGGHSVALFGLELIPKGDGIDGLGEIGHRIHGLGANLLIAIITLHVVAALKHHFMDKDGTIKRMLGARI